MLGSSTTVWTRFLNFDGTFLVIVWTLATLKYTILCEAVEVTISLDFDFLTDA